MSNKNATDNARNFLIDTLPSEFSKYIEKSLVGDFAFMLAGVLKKRAADVGGKNSRYNTYKCEKCGKWYTATHLCDF